MGRGLRIRVLGLATLLAAAVLLCAAPGAFAVTFTVDDSNDLTDSAIDGVCQSVNTTCTLRAAIQEANATGTTDQIDFASTLMGGQTISIAGSMDGITQPVNINACSSVVTPTAPCVGLEHSGMSPGGNGIQISSGGSGTSVKGLAITNFGQGLVAFSGTTGVAVENDSFGLKVDGATLDGNTLGVELTGDSNDVGGTTAAERNVFVGNDTGLQVFTGDGNTVRGNYFGVMPDGTTASGNGDAIEVVGNGTLTPNAPEDNVIGGTVAGGDATSDACDGACNVIANSTGVGIDLQGEVGQSESPAGTTGHGTTIAGNFIGLKATGTAAAANASPIVVGDAVDTLIGGPSAPADRNYISGNSSGVDQSGAGGLTVKNNFFGLRSDGTVSIANSNANASIKGSLAKPTTFTGNQVGGTANGLIVDGVGAVVQSNHFGRTTNGTSSPFTLTAIEVRGSQNTIGGTDAGMPSSCTGVCNEIFNAQGTDTPGINIEGGDGNVVTANFIGGSLASGLGPNTGPGVRIKTNSGDLANDNTIGGTTAGEENVIAFNGGDAIEMSGSGSGNSFPFNRGKNNVGLFVDILTPDGFGSTAGSNGGVQAPVISQATTVVTVGTAPPGSTVRVYFKQFSDAGEVASMLGSVTTPASGVWILHHSPALANGARVTASETTGTSTSELATQALSPTDTTGPQVTITSGPSGATPDPTPTYAFSSNEPVSTFDCRVDGGAFAPCSSPHTTAALGTGSHTFQVRATDASGNLGSATSRNLNVDAAEPDSAITALKTKVKAKKLKQFTGTASDDAKVAKVEVALVGLQNKAKAAKRKKKPACLELQSSGKLRKVKPKSGKCQVSQLNFLTVVGTVNWTFKLKKRLPKGSYVLYVRATDGAGKSEQSFSTADGNRKTFKVN